MIQYEESGILNIELGRKIEIRDSGREQRGGDQGQGVTPLYPSPFSTHLQSLTYTVPSPIHSLPSFVAHLRSIISCALCATTNLTYFSYTVGDKNKARYSFTPLALSLQIIMYVYF